MGVAEATANTTTTTSEEMELYSVQAELFEDLLQQPTADLIEDDSHTGRRLLQDEDAADGLVPESMSASKQAKQLSASARRLSTPHTSAALVSSMAPQAPACRPSASLKLHRYSFCRTQAILQATVRSC